jgi:xanthine dehydrogenase YagR molybdenum-binding subunit
MDTAEAEKSAGVLGVITHKNAPKLNVKGGLRGGALLQSAEIKFYGQHIGVVVAETFEQARYAVDLVKVEYSKSNPSLDTENLEGNAVTPKDNPDLVRGDAAAAFDNSEYKLDAVYSTPILHHHPMEPHSTIAVWEGEKLILYNASQIVNGAQSAAANTLGIPPASVRIVTPFIGGGFGSKGAQWANLVLAAVAAKAVNRPVKLALTRQQMWGYCKKINNT